MKNFFKVHFTSFPICILQNFQSFLVWAVRMVHVVRLSACWSLWALLRAMRCVCACPCHGAVPWPLEASSSVSLLPCDCRKPGGSHLLVPVCMWHGASAQWLFGVRIRVRTKGVSGGKLLVSVAELCSGYSLCVSKRKLEYVLHNHFVSFSKFPSIVGYLGPTALCLPGPPPWPSQENSLACLSPYIFFLVA